MDRWMDRYMDRWMDRYSLRCVSQARGILAQAAEAGAPFITCADETFGDVLYYEWRRDGPDGAGYYRHAAAPESSDPIEASLCMLREAVAAGADFVRYEDYIYIYIYIYI